MSTGGYPEIHIQRLFFDNKSILKFLGLQTYSSASSTFRNFYIWKTLKSQLLVVFQNFIFGQILANFGSFRQFWPNLAKIRSIDNG
jgi:hypothetical protein